MDITGKQFIVAAFGIFVVYYKSVDSRNVIAGSGRVGEILPFWEPDPRFLTNRPENRRSNKNKNNEKYRDDKGNRNQLNKLSRTSSESDAAVKDFRTKQDEVQKIKDGIQGRRSQATTNHVSTRFTPMDLKDGDDKPHPKDKEGGQIKNKDENEDSDDYENNFVLTSYQVGEQFQKLLYEYPNANVSSEVLGRTASYNDILLFKISSSGLSKYFRTDENKYIPEVPQKKIIFIVHALSSMGLGKLYSLTVERYLKELLSYYLAHLDKFDIFLMPMANPDGFIRVKKLTYWNKNTSPQPECDGVAVDRNFDVAWNNSRRISSCSQHYPGPRPFSEPESAAVGDIFHKYSHKIIAYFHVHAGQYDTATFKGDAVLYPKGFTEHQSSDDDKYIDLKGEIDEAMNNADFRTVSVTVDTLYNWYGKISGSSVDYAATVYGIPFAMEFVMQLYQDPLEINVNRMRLGDTDEIEYYALTEIWKRIINVTFLNIWKKSSGIELNFNEM